MAERAERVRKAQEKSNGNLAEDRPSQASSVDDAEPLSDYWKLPKTGAPTTLLNSAWTWTLITYVAIMAIAVLSIAQQGSGLLDSQSNTARIAIAVGLLYPAWRIGSLISKFMKSRGIGAGFSVTGAARSSLGGENSAKAVKPGSAEARMAERKARLEKARREGKI